MYWQQQPACFACLWSHDGYYDVHIGFYDGYDDFYIGFYDGYDDFYIGFHDGYDGYHIGNDDFYVGYNLADDRPARSMCKFRPISRRYLSKNPR